MAALGTLEVWWRCRCHDTLLSECPNRDKIAATLDATRAAPVPKEDWQCTVDGCYLHVNHGSEHEPGMCECGFDMDAHAGGWTLLHHDNFIEESRAALAQPEAGIDVAWAAAEKALPDGWDLSFGSHVVRGGYFAVASHPTEEHEVTSGDDERWPTPAAALMALAARLTAPGKSA